MLGGQTGPPLAGVFIPTITLANTLLPPESAHPGQHGGCFPASAKVLTSRGTKQMSQLRPGDNIQAVDSTGALVYSEILMFLDRSPSEVRKFVTLVTEGGRRLTVTPAHLVFAGPGGCQDLSCMEATYAGVVEEGQAVMVEEESRLVASRVQEVSLSTEHGVFAPLTREGNLVVEGVLASSYAVIDSQGLAHTAFAPVRWACNFAENMRSLWRTVSFTSSTPRSSETLSEGVHWYPRTLYSIGSWLVPSHMLP